MRYFILTLAVLAACNPTREKTDTTNYDVISEKCFVMREHPTVTDSLVNASRELLVQYLKEQQFPVRYIKKDSLMFRRTNGLQVDLVLPTPQDAWESNTIIVFDPAKNPLFVNLHKGTAQVEQYIKEK
ncbi:hypothetical protein GFS24_15585 [Chitinophaga sp. SYP-B3965]|uniref:hypothetical protein n=1 Tax=Chitinophaga sp. SYP-B3965 TaxID=2663120 RepID=UPI001299C074|nr:hypothetical protein [Chitinophaga sp. SYP-B3965]MRG46544.1 hypothetical protein [Chitinophaga sp. SYP-B3965]